MTYQTSPGCQILLYDCQGKGDYKNVKGVRVCGGVGGAPLEKGQGHEESSAERLREEEGGLRETVGYLRRRFTISCEASLAPACSDTRSVETFLCRGFSALCCAV
jgi:hypothetical protein